MVYIPFLKIEIPEPRLQEVVPNTITFVISLLNRVLQTANEVINPMTPEEQEAYDKAIEDTLPRELKNVLAKYDAGAIKDDAKLSSEVEEACYDYYRRTMRQNIAGYSDEETEDWAARKTLDLSSPQQAVLEAHARLVESQLASSSQQQLNLELESDEGRRDPQRLAHYLQEQQELMDSFAAAAEQEREAAQQQRRQRQSLPRRVVGVTASGALGMAAGVGVVRLLRTLYKRVSEGRRPKAAAGKKQGASKGSSKKRSSGSGTKTGGQRRRPTQ